MECRMKKKHAAGRTLRPGRLDCGLWSREAKKPTTKEEVRLNKKWLPTCTYEGRKETNGKRGSSPLPLG